MSNDAANLWEEVMDRLESSIDKLLQHAVNQGHVPGVSAMVIDGQQTLYQGAFGERSLGGSDAMTLDTVVAIASMTKAITSVAALQLVENEALTLDTPAFEIIPWLGDVEVLEGFDPDGTPKTRAPKQSITLRHLLTHTSGFGYDFWNQEYIDYREATGMPTMSSGKLDALQMPLLFDPGSRWNYSIGTDWVGRLIEEVSGLSLGEYLQQNVFSPLGMTSTAFAPNEDMANRLASLHQRGADDDLSLFQGALIPTDAEFEMGGGGLLSTLEDYATFLQMILNQGRHKGEQFLSHETITMMSVNQMGENRVLPLETAVPPLSNDVDFFPGIEKSWSLAFMINHDQAPTGRSPGSTAWAGLGNTYFWIDPTKDIAGIFFSQILPFGDKKSLPLYLDFEKSVYDHLQD